MVASDPGMNALYTIGHSSHSWLEFAELLTQHAIEVVCDVRSNPTSRRFPQYDRRSLQANLEAIGIKYLWLGEELGGRGSAPGDYRGGTVSYQRLATKPGFVAGLERVRAGVVQCRIALMCAEKDPASCHRAILICRNLRDDPFEIKHILSDGALESHCDLDRRLLRINKLPEVDMFEPTESLIGRAYAKQEARIAHSRRSFGDGEDTDTLREEPG